MMETEEQAEFILGVLERQAEECKVEYAKQQLIWADPITWPNHEELLGAINDALEGLAELEADA